VIDQNMPQPSVNFKDEDLSTFDIIMQQRKCNQANNYAAANQSGVNMQIDPKNQIPPELERQYQVFIVNGANAKKIIKKMRDIKSDSIGSMVTVKGIVTRAADVKPCLQVAVYACDVCGCEVYQVVNSREFNPKVECPSQKCVTNMTKGQLVMQIKSSKFMSFQELKIQEPSEQVPIGHVPRAMKVYAKGVITR
jgi:DNA replication licensing factor MCM7